MPLRLSRYQNGKSITNVYASQKLQPFNSLRMLCQTFMRASYHKSCLWILLLFALPCAASVSFTNLLNNGSTTPANSFATASVTPTSNAPLMLSFGAHLNSGNGPGNILSVASTGLTWSAVKRITYGGAVGAGKTNQFEVWCGYGSSPSAGAITVTFGIGISPTVVSWVVDNTSGAASTCPLAIGSTPGGVGQDTATASPMSTTIAFDTTGSSTYVAGDTDATDTISPGAGFTGLGSGNINSHSVGSAYAASEISPALLTYGGANVRWSVVAVELKVPASTGGRKPLVIQ